MSYTYLTIEERSKIEVLVQEGYKINHIANLLGRHRSTIYRELNRCSTPSYVAKASQADANQLASHKGRKAKHNFYWFSRTDLYPSFEFPVTVNRYVSPYFASI